MSEVVPDAAISAEAETDAIDVQPAEPEAPHNLLRESAEPQAPSAQEAAHNDAALAAQAPEDALLLRQQQQQEASGSFTSDTEAGQASPPALEAQRPEAPEEQGTSDTPEEKETQTGAFSDKIRLPYPNAPGVRAQGFNDDCLPTAVGMVADSYGITDPYTGNPWDTSRISAALQSQNGADWRYIYEANSPNPAHPTRVTDAFPLLGLPDYEARPNVTIQELAAATQKGPAIVSLDVPKGMNVPLAPPGDLRNLGRHAVVVDKIDNGVVYIRDPRGTAYGVTVQEFLGNFGGTPVANQPNEWARFNGIAAIRR